jgi:cobalamin synthase
MTKFSSRCRLRTLGAIAAIGLPLGAVAVAAAPSSTTKANTLQLAAFHSRFGGSRFGGGSLFSRRRPYGYGYRGRYYSRPSLLHRIVRALALAYILHLLFTNGVFSLVLWVLVIALISHLFRRRSRRYSY